jgi:plasmid stabilization system protein ParE
MLSPSLFRPQAWQDALDIVAYIAADNASAAERFVPALEDTCTQLVALPGLGNVRSFHDADLTPVSSTGPETHAKQLALSYVFDLLWIFHKASR